MSVNADKECVDILDIINRVMTYMESRHKTPHSIVKRTKQYLKIVGLTEYKGYTNALKVCLLMHGLEDVMLS